MSVDSPKDLVPKFFDNTAASYDGIANWATLGKDKYWKNKILDQIIDGKSFLDLACGTGILTRKIARKFPDSTVIGVDITESYLNIAKKNSQDFENISFIHHDAETINLDTKFDYITSSYIPKYCNPKVLVKNCISHLNDGGKIIFHDFIYPKNKFVRIIWNTFFVLLNFIGFFIPSWKNAFRELPKLIRSSTWVSSYAYEMEKAGLEVNYQYFTWNSVAILTGSKTLP